MNLGSLIEYPLLNGPVIRIEQAFDQDWSDQTLTKLLSVSTLWTPYTSPESKDKVTSHLIKDFEHLPKDLVEKLKRIIQVKWGAATSLARCFLNQAHIEEITAPHRDLAGLLKGYTVVIFLKASTQSKAELTFYDEGPEQNNVILKECIGDLILFPGHLLHQQGKGSGRTTLVLNFLEQI